MLLQVLGHERGLRAATAEVQGGEGVFVEPSQEVVDGEPGEDALVVATEDVDTVLLDQEARLGKHLPDRV